MIFKFKKTSPVENVRLLNGGFSVTEVILSAAIFGLLVTALIGALIYGRESSVLAGHRARAVMLAEEGIEAVKNIQDQNFANLSEGTYGLSATGDQWTLEDTGDISGRFERQITISSVEANTKDVSVTVVWQQNRQRAGSVNITTRFTNWQEDSEIGFCDNQADYLIVDTDEAFLAVANRELRDVFLTNSEPECEIMIDKMAVVWTTADRQLERIRLANRNVWVGSADSGQEVDIENMTLTHEDESVDARYRFNASMAGDVLDLIYIMSDNTVKIESDISL